MKRRKFGLLAGSSLAGLAGVTAGLTATDVKPAKAAADASLLTTTLNPMGGIRAGNADGSIPAWTGGYTTVPAGFKPGDYIGELWPDEQPILTIDASNVAQHSDMINPGTVEMINKYGFKVNVFPTHRTAAAPQAVYDAIAANVKTAQFNPQGPRFGFSNAIGGVPFPIPDTSDPLVAGAQLINNSTATWRGYAKIERYEGWVVSSGQLSLGSIGNAEFRYPYYQAQSIADYIGVLDQLNLTYTAPAGLVGQALVIYQYSNPYSHPQQAWELLNGQGRVRRAPEVAFDTPTSASHGIANYDESFGFNGSLERYNWKCLGKKEMYIPYNNNKLFGVPAQTAHLSSFINPELVRWEKHRVWVVEATLAPGERSVDAKRVLWVDEDTYQIMVVDLYDAENNLVKTSHVYLDVRPELPGTCFGNSSVYNLQSGDYTTLNGMWDQKVNPGGLVFASAYPPEDFDPIHMAASAQY